jgi:hypothetical protein
MQYLCLGNRDKKYIEIIGVSDCDDFFTAYQRNIEIMSINLTESEFYKIKTLSEFDKLNKELVVIQAESFMDARKIIYNNNYKEIPAYANSGIIRKSDKFLNFKMPEKNSMLAAKK